MIGIQSDRVRTELSQIKEIVVELCNRVDAGIPGADIPANEINEEVFQVQLQGELRLAAQRLIALAEVIGD